MRSVSVIGATGFVGGRLFRHLRQRASHRLAITGTSFHAPREPEVSPLDVTDSTALAAHLEKGFDLVLVAAGTKDVKRCEQDLDYALALNTLPVREMVRVVDRGGLGTRIVYLSTDYVFDGERGLYREADAAEPKTNYGRSKLLGEQALLATGRGHKVLRSGAVLGRGAAFFDWVLAEVGAGREIRLFEDSFVSPTPIELLGDVVLELLCAYDEVPDRILHGVGDRRMSRLEIGRLLAALAPPTGAILVPERRVAGGTLFQRDLSLRPSTSARAWQRFSLEEYLRREMMEGSGAR